MQQQMNDALMTALEDGSTEDVHRLVKQGANVNHRCYNCNCTPLFRACDKEECAIVSLLVEFGADVNAQKATSRDTPLMAAAWWGNLNIVKLLLKAGANPEIENMKGNTACSFAKDAMRIGVEGRSEETFRQQNYIAIVHEINSSIGTRTFQRRMRRFRGVVRAIDAFTTLYQRAAHRVNAPGGVGFNEARKDFERHLSSALM